MDRRIAAELVVDARATLGEGPVWDAVRGVMWWVDILAGLIHAFDPATGRDESTEVGQAVGAVALREGGDLVVLGQDAILMLDPESRRFGPVLAFDRESPRQRTNDAKPDPAGRLWLGRMALDHSVGHGSLYRLGRDLALTKVLEALTTPNGLAWSPDGRTMYFVESTSRVVTAYDFDPTTGGISDGRCFLRAGAEIGLPARAVPDGLTVDAQGFVWVAAWGGGCVLRVAPDGAVAGRIDLPVSQVSSCAFGGSDLADLYITTAREGFDEADAAREPVAGGLFRVRPGVPGLSPHRFGG